jgi:hypothetical protein
MAMSRGLCSSRLSSQLPAGQLVSKASKLVHFSAHQLLVPKGLQKSSRSANLETACCV